MEPRKTPYTKAEKISSLKIQHYMMAEIADHVDALTGEVNSTTLAEDACQHFDAYEGADYSIPDKFFDIALLVGEAYEIKTGVKEAPRKSISAALSGLINSKDSGWF